MIDCLPRLFFTCEGGHWYHIVRTCHDWSVFSGSLNSTRRISGMWKLNQTVSSSLSGMHLVFMYTLYAGATHHIQRRLFT